MAWYESEQEKKERIYQEGVEDGQSAGFCSDIGNLIAGTISDAIPVPESLRQLNEIRQKGREYGRQNPKADDSSEEDSTDTSDDSSSSDDSDSYSSDYQDSGDSGGTSTSSTSKPSTEAKGSSASPETLGCGPLVVMALIGMVALIVGAIQPTTQTVGFSRVQTRQSYQELIFVDTPKGIERAGRVAPTSGIVVPPTAALSGRCALVPSFCSVRPKRCGCRAFW